MAVNSSESRAIAAKLDGSAGACLLGVQQNGPFTVDEHTAQHWLAQPSLGTHITEVMRPWSNGKDITDRSSKSWIIDFGLSMSENDAALMELPFAHLTTHVKPMRLAGRRESRKKYWWRLGEPSPALRRALANLPTFLATPRVAKHRVWTKLPTAILPDIQLVVVARADDTTFGILHSRFHELWSLRMCTWLGVGNDPRYTPTTCFETFPFPAGLTPLDTAHQRTETLPNGAVIPADIYKENQPLALMDKAQAATKTISTSANETIQPTAAEVGVARMSGAISKSAAYEPPASEPAPPDKNHSRLAPTAPMTSTSADQTAKSGKSATPAPEPTLRDHAIAIAQAAKKLNDLRENWLNPPEWTHKVPEVTPLGMDHSPYPDRIEPKPGISEPDLKALQKRTLTNLYNAQPAWLTMAHQQLNTAVAAAYGWADYTPAMPDDEILKRLLALNLARSST